MKIYPRPNRRFRRSDEAWMAVAFCMFVSVMAGFALSGWTPGANPAGPVGVPPVVAPVVAAPAPLDPCRAAMSVVDRIPVGDPRLPGAVRGMKGACGMAVGAPAAPRAAAAPVVAPKAVAAATAPSCPTYSNYDSGPKRLTTYNCHGSVLSVVYGK